MLNPAPGFKKNPNRRVHLEPSPRRVRVKFGDEWIADSNKRGQWNRWVWYIIPIRYGVRVNAPTEVWWYGSWAW